MQRKERPPRNKGLPAGRQGFTLVELIVYTAIFAIVAGILTSIFLLIVSSQKKTSVSNEVTQQLNFVLVTAQRLIGDSSLVEAVYEGSSPSSTCSTFCTLRLRSDNPAKDPTIISSNASGIYLQEGSSTQVTLTTNRVLVNHLRLVKHEIPGGHAVVEISTSFSYNTSNPTFAVTKAIQSAIARVNAATFDADLIPNQDNTFDIGQIGSNLRWKNGRFSGDLTVGGNLGIGTTSPLGPLHVSAASANNALVILSSGNVGVGLGSPSYTLDVAGGLRATATSTFSGNLGVGLTFPSYKLDVNGIVNAVDFYKDGAPLMSGTTVATSVSGCGTASNGKECRLRIGSSPYQFITIVYDSTYGKWVGSQFTLFSSTSNQNGSTQQVPDPHGMWFGSVSTNSNLYPGMFHLDNFDAFLSAGLNLQLRQTGIARATGGNPSSAVNIWTAADQANPWTNNNGAYADSGLTFNTSLKTFDSGWSTVSGIAARHLAGYIYINNGNVGAADVYYSGSVYGRWVSQ